MSSLSSNEILDEFKRSKMGIVGIGILIGLVTISIVSVIVIPVDTFREWNNPSSWLSYPKTAAPSWVNYFLVEKIPEHKTLGGIIGTATSGEISVVSQQFVLSYQYDLFPSDFIHEYTVKYSGSPLLEISVIRPDELHLKLFTSSLPNSYTETATVLHRHVAQMDADAESHPTLVGEALVARAQDPLNLHRTLDGIQGGRKLGEDVVAGVVHNPAPVLAHQARDHAAIGREDADCLCFVLGHQAAVADDIGTQQGR